MSQTSSGSTSSASGVNTSKPSGSEKIPTILSHPLVEDYSNRDTDSATRLQESAGIWARAKWSASDREKFFGGIAQLKESNDTLQSLIEIRSISNSTVYLSDITGDLRLAKQVSSTQDNLDQLHRALMASNGISLGDALEFSIKLSTDYSQTKTEFAGHEIPELTKESDFFILQAHEVNNKEAGHQSRFLVIESPPVQRSDHGTGSEAQICPKKIKNLRHALVQRSASPENSNVFEHLGYLPSPRNPTHSHCVYQAVDDLGERYKTLADVLAVEELGNVKFSSKHLDLAILITRSHLCFIKTKPLSTLSKLTDYVYYRSTTFKDDNDGTEYVNPYLFHGFGSPSKKKGSQAIGKASGVARSWGSQALALGILLYQIAS